MSCFVTDLPMIVKCENPTGGRSWFFTLVGHKVFHVKILVFFIFPHYLPTMESRSVSKISLTDCSRELGKNTIHPPLVSCTLKSTLNLHLNIVGLKFTSLLRYRLFCVFLLMDFID